MIRPSRPGDEAALKRLWQIAFGDTPADIDRFFSRLYQPGDALLWTEEGDVIASAIYLLEAGFTTLADGQRHSTAYAYALATLPAYRGRGLASRLTKAALKHSFAIGFALNIICPAEESLFPYYSRLGYKHILPIAQGQVHLDKSRDTLFMNQIMSISFSDYSQLRHALLPTFSTAYAPAFLRYVEAMGQAAGGGLFRLDLDGQLGCAAAEWRDGRLFVREILPASLAVQGVQALGAYLSAQQAVFRTIPDPVSAPQIPRRPFALMACSGGDIPTAADGYFPFTLD